MKLHRQRGFTLVELLVVIGIIALLIAILLPALGKARQAANKAACLSNLHQIGIAMAGYESTFKGTLPQGVDFFRGVTWWSLLAQQMGNKFQAVNNLGASASSNVVNSYQAGTPIANIYAAGFDNRLGVFKCKDAVATEPKSLVNYSCHPLLMPDGNLQYPAGFPEASLVGTTPPTYRAPYKVSHIPNPYQIALVFDGTQCLKADLTPAGSPPASVPVQVGDSAACAYNIDGNRIANAGTVAPTGTTYLIAGYKPGGTNVDLSQSIETGPNMDSPTDAGGGSPFLWGNVRWRHSGNTIANALFADGHAGSFFFKRTSPTQGTTDFLRRNLYVPQP